MQRTTQLWIGAMLFQVPCKETVTVLRALVQHRTTENTRGWLDVLSFAAPLPMALCSRWCVNLYPESHFSPCRCRTALIQWGNRAAVSWLNLACTGVQGSLKAEECRMSFQQGSSGPSCFCRSPLGAQRLRLHPHFPRAGLSPIHSQVQGLRRRKGGLFGIPFHVLNSKAQQLLPTSNWLCITPLFSGFLAFTKDCVRLHPR